MTLLFMDGFHGGDIPTKWNPGSFGTRGTSTPRFPGGAYTTGTTSASATIPAAAEVFAAAAFIWTGALTAANLQFGDAAGGATHITVMRSSAGFIEVRRGNSSGTIIATGSTAIPASTWTHVQARVTISDTIGIVQVRLNGASSNEIDFLGDTKNGGSGTTIDTVSVFLPANSTYLATDVVILNTAGSVNNTWPGDCRVQTLTPNGDGATSQGVGSDGNSVSNYLLVDETPFSSTDYVGITTDTQGDTYALTDLAAGTSTIKAVQFNMNVAKSDVGAKSVKRRIRSAGTTYAGSAVTLGTSYVTIVEVLESDPATSTAWTAAGVNAVEAGVEAAP